MKDDCSPETICRYCGKLLEIDMDATSDSGNEVFRVCDCIRKQIAQAS